MDYTIRIGGEAGQGIQTVGGTLAGVFAKSGYHVFTNQDYESRVRGGHNFYQVRLSDKPVTASRDNLDIVVALDGESILRYERALGEKGILVYDSAALQQQHDKPHFLNVPFTGLAEEHGGSKIMANTVAVGAVLGMLGMKLDILMEIIQSTFKKKGEEVIQGNIKAATAGHSYAVDNCGERCAFIPASQSEKKMLIDGTSSVALGAIMSGCKFYSAYPMTPSTGVMVYLASRAGDYGIVVEQAEDEIAAINMALGASFAGVRAMTGTSGGGFALMAEGLSLAGMTETPIVIFEGQRPGPATGFPTRTEQGDLLFILHAGHGEFPRVVFAPGSPEQAFYLTNKAFDMAEKYQIPVFVMSDTYLADSEWTFNGFDVSKLRYKEYRLRSEQLNALDEYKRHAFTEDGVTPLGVPGCSGHLVVTDSDEHDEEGHIVEDAETRIKMTEKRLFKKLPRIKEEIEPPMFYGNDRPEVVIVGWGSTFGVMREAVDDLSGENRIAMLHFSELYPFPSSEKFDYLGLLRNASLTICVENNATGQFEQLVRAETGYEFNRNIRKYDGRPFVREELVSRITSLIM